VGKRGRKDGLGESEDVSEKLAILKKISNSSTIEGGRKGGVARNESSHANDLSGRRKKTSGGRRGAKESFLK